MRNKVDFLKGFAKGLKLDEKTDDVSKLLSAIIDCIDSMADQIDINTDEIDDMNDAIDELQDSIDDLEDVLDDLDDFDDFDDDDDFDFDDDDEDEDDDDDDPDGSDLHTDVPSNAYKYDFGLGEDKVVMTKSEIDAFTKEMDKLISTLSDKTKTK